MSQKLEFSKTQVIIRKDLYQWLKKEAAKNGFRVWKQLEEILKEAQQKNTS